MTARAVTTSAGTSGSSCWSWRSPRRCGGGGRGSRVWVTGGLAAVIVVREGAQHLYQFQEHWITYCSALMTVGDRRLGHAEGTALVAGTTKPSQAVVVMR